MLVAAFKVEVCRELVQIILVAAAHHGKVRGAGIKPNVENVARLYVLADFVGREELFGLGLNPGFNAFFFDALGDFFHDFKSPGVQFTRGLIHEEGKRHTPVALTGNTPVGAVFDHGVQAVVAPAREKLRAVNALKCGFTQSLRAGRFPENALGVRIGLIHSHKPLGRGAVDQRGLMTPAVHVAVVHLAHGVKSARDTQGVNDLRLRLPDEKSSEKREPVGVDAVTLHGIKDLIVGHSVLFAAHKVIHAVGRCRVHDTRAGCGFNVVCEIHGRKTLIARVDIVQGMAEPDTLKLFALGGRNNRPGLSVAL